MDPSMIQELEINLLLETLYQRHGHDFRGFSRSEEEVSVDKEKVAPLLAELAGHLETNSLMTDPLMDALEDLLGKSHLAAAFEALKTCVWRYDFGGALQVLKKIVKEPGLG